MADKTSDWFSGYDGSDLDAQMSVEGRKPRLIRKAWAWKAIVVRTPKAPEKGETT